MVRIYTPENGWGTVLSLGATLPQQDEPDVLALVKFDSGGGGWVNPSHPQAVIEGAVELARMLREEVQPPAMPPMLPLGL